MPESGDTTRELLARFQRDVAMRAPDLVILWAGVNDRLYPGHTVEPAEFRANYAELLDRIRVVGAKVLIGTLPPQYKPYLFTQFPPSRSFRKPRRSGWPRSTPISGASAFRWRISRRWSEAVRSTKFPNRICGTSRTAASPTVCI